MAGRALAAMLRGRMASGRNPQDAKRRRVKRAAELRRDPGDLVLTGRGTAAQERKRDPGDLLLRSVKRGRRRRVRKSAVGFARNGRP